MNDTEPAAPPLPAVPAANGLWRPVRKIAVAVMGATLLVIGGVLVLIPGPPGWPLVLGGLALLATEFAWARSMFTSTRDWLSKRNQAKA